MTLQHLRSSTANKRPVPGSMADGQLGVNLEATSPGVFFKNSAGNLVKVGPVHVGTTAPNVSPAGQSGNSTGEQWLDTTGGTYNLKIWDGSAWRSEAGEFVNVTGDTMTGALAIIAGSASAPGLAISGDSNTGIYSPGADQLALTTGGTQRLTTDTAAVTSTLPVVHPLGAAATPSITFTGDLNTGIYSPGADQVALTTGGTGRLFIDSSGRLLAGTSTARSNFFGTTLSSLTQIEGTGGSTARGSLSVLNNDVSNNPPYVLLGRSGAASLGSNAVVVSGSRLGTLTFHGADGTSFIEAATVAGEVDGTPGSNDMPGRLVFSTTSDNAGSPTERMRLDSSGRLGLGTSSPGERLTVAGNISLSATQPYISLIDSGWAAGTTIRSGVNTIGTATGDYQLFNVPTGKGFAFAQNNATNSLVIDSSGRLLVGTSTARSNVYGSFSPYLQLEGGSVNGQDMLLITRNQNDIYGPLLTLAKSRGTANTIVASGDLLGTVSMVGNDGSSFIQAARIEAFVDGTPGANDMPGRLVFSTTADGASSPTERMRIHANGYITYGTGILDSTGLTFGPTRSGAGSAPTLTWNGSFTGTTTACDFLYNGVRQGSITTTTSATAYNTSSDYRLKENIEPLTGASGRLNQLQVHRFNFISDPGRTVDGFIAHEAQAVVPECVTGEKDAEDEDGNPKYQGIDQSKLVPLLTAALQEAIAEIASLKDRVAALEGA